MSDHANPLQAQYAVCNPMLSFSPEEREREIRKSLQIVKIGNRYHILEIRRGDGFVYDDWGGFDCEFSAELFQTNLIAEAIDGNPRNACCSGSAFEFFDTAGKIFEIIKAHEGDTGSLAIKIASEEPWSSRFNPAQGECDLPF